MLLVEGYTSNNIVLEEFLDEKESAIKTEILNSLKNPNLEYDLLCKQNAIQFLRQQGDFIYKPYALAFIAIKIAPMVQTEIKIENLKNTAFVNGDTTLYEKHRRKRMIVNEEA